MLAPGDMSNTAYRADQSQKETIFAKRDPANRDISCLNNTINATLSSFMKKKVSVIICSVTISITKYSKVSHIWDTRFLLKLQKSGFKSTRVNYNKIH